MAANKGGKPFLETSHIATDVADRCHGQLLQTPAVGMGCQPTALPYEIRTCHT